MQECSGGNVRKLTLGWILTLPYCTWCAYASARKESCWHPEGRSLFCCAGFLLVHLWLFTGDTGDFWMRRKHIIVVGRVHLRTCSKACSSMSVWPCHRTARLCLFWTPKVCIDKLQRSYANFSIESIGAAVASPPKDFPHRDLCVLDPQREIHGNQKTKIMARRFATNVKRSHKRLEKRKPYFYWLFFSLCSAYKFTNSHLF